MLFVKRLKRITTTEYNIQNDSWKRREHVLDKEALDYYHNGSNLVYYCQRGRRSEEKWEEYKKRLAPEMPDASMFGLTFHRGTQRSFIFAVHPEDAEEYLAIAKGFLDTSWKEHFSYEEVK